MSKAPKEPQRPLTDCAAPARHRRAHPLLRS